MWSGWQDSNLRPSAPKADALTGLRYTPKQPTVGPNGLLIFGRGQLSLQIVHMDHLVAVAVLPVGLFLGYNNLGELLGLGFLLENLIAEGLLLCH